jgi:hypothetical protein
MLNPNAKPHNAEPPADDAARWRLLKGNPWETPNDRRLSLENPLY